MRKRCKKSVAQKIVDRLREFAEKLEAGEDFEVTEVYRVETPDGPMHEFKKVSKRLDGGHGLPGTHGGLV